MERTSLTSAGCWGRLEAQVDKAMTVRGLEGGPPTSSLPEVMNLPPRTTVG